MKSCQLNTNTAATAPRWNSAITRAMDQFNFWLLGVPNSSAITRSPGCYHSINVAAISPPICKNCVISNRYDRRQRGILDSHDLNVHVGYTLGGGTNRVLPGC